MSLKTKKWKNFFVFYKIKETEENSHKKIKELEAKLKELEDKNENLTANQITNNFGKKIIKNW